VSLAKRINQLSEERDFGTAFVNAMDLAIKEAGKPRRSKPNIKPSKAGCLRQMYYILVEAPVDGKETVDPNMYLIQKDGTYMHTVLQEILAGAKNQGIEMLDPEAEIVKARQQGIDTIVIPSTHADDSPYEIHCYNRTYGISFKFDGMGIFMKKKFILEIKNEDHYKFLKRAQPEPEHIAPQGTMYSLCLGVNYVLFIYVNRNYKRRKAYLVEITESMRQNQLDRIKLVRYASKKGLVPIKEVSKTCRYCNYKKLCKTHGETEMNLDWEEIRNSDGS
jgi:CRISPR/Cas system-associated exonuclease Cas4 (RecB family)